ncbi:phage tail tape measure protein [Thermosipho sp. 1074]|uniref:phage tail tape measure protein n=1 Tax=Thermosipho sp. 1074 TaxID=1643331 RepID=UPI001E2C2A76|nr:phage tail tape measure protein [Thermosipho sp. 1074]
MSPVLKNVAANLGNFQKRIDSIRAGLQQFSNAINTALRYTAAFTTALAGAVSASSYFAAKVEKSFQNARTMMKMTAEEAKNMQKGLLQLSVQAGKSLDELNNALYMLGSAGVEAKDALNVLRQTTISSIAGATDLTTTFQSAISIINAYGMSIDDLTSVYAMQFEAVKKGLLTYDELARDFGVLIPSARNLGVSLQEALASYTALTTAGFRSSEAANAAEGAFQDLMQQADKFRKLGIDIYDSEGRFIGLTKVVKQLKETMQDLTDDEKRALLQQLALSETGTRALLTWVNNYEKFQDVLSGIQGNTDALMEAYKTQTQSISFLLDRLKSSVQAVNIAFFNAIRSNVVEYLGKFINFLGKVEQWINSNKDKIGDLVFALLRLSATFLGVLLGLKLFSQGAQLLMFLLKPMNLLILGIVWAVYELWKAFYKGNDYVKNFGGFLMFVWDKFKAFVNFIKGEIEKIKKLAGENAGFWDWVVAIILYIGQQLAKVFKAIFDWFMKLLEDFWNKIKDKFGGGTKIFLIPAIIRTVRTGGGNSPSGGTVKTKEEKEITVKTIMDTATQKIIAFMESFANSVAELTLKILADLSKLPQWLKDVLEQTKEQWDLNLRPVLDFAQEITLNFKENLANISAWIKEGIRELQLKLKWAENFVLTGWKWLIEGAQTIKITLQKAWGKAFEWLEKGFQEIKLHLRLWLPKRETETSMAKEPTTGIVSTETTISFIPRDFNKVREVATDFVYNIGDVSDALVGLNVAINETSTALNTVATYNVPNLDEVVRKFVLNKQSYSSGTPLRVHLYQQPQPFAMFMPIFDFIGALSSVLGISTSAASAFSLGTVLGYAEGGYTGSGTTYEPAGIVHKGEYVIPAWMVQKYPQLIALLERKRLKGYQEGGIVDAIISYFAGSGNVNVYKDIEALKETGSIAVQLLKDTNPEIGASLETIAKKVGIITNEVKTNIKETQYDKGFKVGFGPGKVLFELMDKGKNILNTVKTNLEELPNTTKQTFKDLEASLSGFWAGLKQSFNVLTNINVGELLVGATATAFEEIGNFFGALAGQISPLLLSLENLINLLNPMATIAQAMMTVLQPLIEGALKPFVTILNVFGQLLGTLLLPLLEPFLGALQMLGVILQWVYNTVIVPIGRGFYIVFGMIASAFNWLYNVISDIVKALTFGAVNMGHRAVKSLEQIIKEANEKIQGVELNFEEATTPEITQQYTATVTRQGPETVNIYQYFQNSNFLDSAEAFKEMVVEAVKEALEEGTLVVNG